MRDLPHTLQKVAPIAPRRLPVLPARVYAQGMPACHHPPEIPAVPLLFAKRNFLSASLTSSGMSTVRDYDMISVLRFCHARVLTILSSARRGVRVLGMNCER
jgi:hypothetical protein